MEWQDALIATRSQQCKLAQSGVCHISVVFHWGALPLLAVDTLQGREALQNRTTRAQFVEASSSVAIHLVQHLGNWGNGRLNTSSTWTSNLVLSFLSSYHHLV